MKIIHCFRSPVGGIFRHVRDLLAEQQANGHEIGFICDSLTGGKFEDALFKEIEPQLALGLYRLPMARSISPRDAISLWQIRKIINSVQPNVVHSHSAKGGVYGRLATKLLSSNTTKSFYCPHGGAMHYSSGSLKGKVFFAAERFLEPYTDSLIFISTYERDAYHAKVGKPRCRETVIYNGLSKEEFEPVKTEKNAADFLYIGMMRDLKGPDLFLDALKLAREKSGKNLTASFVGDGPNKDKYISKIGSDGLTQVVSVHDAMPARDAFTQAKIVVVPSRAESLPYLVLEAVAAQKPTICTDVGSIYEIFGDQREQLVPPDRVDLLCDAMLKMHSNRSKGKQARQLAAAVEQRFSVKTMAANIEAVYRS